MPWPEFFERHLADEQSDVAAGSLRLAQAIRRRRDQALGREQLRRRNHLVIARRQQEQRRAQTLEVNPLAERHEVSGRKFVVLVKLLDDFEIKASRQIDGPGIPILKRPLDFAQSAASRPAPASAAILEPHQVR